MVNFYYIYGWYYIYGFYYIFYYIYKWSLQCERAGENTSKYVRFHTKKQ